MRLTFIRLFFVVVALAFSAVPALAQQIQGQVRYADTNQPAARVPVRCNGVGCIPVLMTDNNGKFVFNVSVGHYTISVQIPGYVQQEESRDLLDLQSNEYIFFKLKPDGNPKPVIAAVVDANVPDAARKEFAKADEALATGKKEKLEEAVQHLEKAVSLYPRFLEAQLKLGTTYMDLQQFDKAEPALKKTLEIDPKAANALFALGEVYLRQKKDEDAEKVLLQGLGLEDRSYQGHLTLARVYLDMASKIKDETQSRPFLEKAYDQVNEALKLNPDLAQAHLVKGNLLLRVRRAADAQHEFEEYLRLDPKGPAAEQTRALVEKIKKALEADKKP
jgi:tetratricopeptide (TPR) repeat protein